MYLMSILPLPKLSFEVIEVIWTPKSKYLKMRMVGLIIASYYIFAENTIVTGTSWTDQEVRCQQRSEKLLILKNR